jgi:hypothetical protein
VLVVGCLLGVLGVAACVSFPFIQFIQAKRDAERRFAVDVALATPVLSADPTFHRLIPVNFPVAGFCLSGPVPTRTDCDRLRSRMKSLFGEERMGHVMADVWIEDE